MRHEGVTAIRESNRPKESAALRELVRRKLTFVISSLAFYFLCFFPLPILNAFITVLTGRATGPISWADNYWFAQFVVPWVVASLCWRKPWALSVPAGVAIGMAVDYCSLADRRRRRC